MIMFGYSPLADVVVKLGTGGNTEVHLSAKVDSFTSGGVSNPFFQEATVLINFYWTSSIWSIIWLS